jgi:transposase
MCNEIDYEMMRKYLAKPKQKEPRKKEPEKQILEAMTT